MDSLFFIDDNDDNFPSPSKLVTDDLAVIGSNLKPETIIKAYKMGYFPWYNEGDPRCWFHMDPRLVLFPKNLHVSRSMRPEMKKFRFTMDTAFPEVVRACRMVQRSRQELGTWISDEIEASYFRLFELGYGHSAEAWQGKELVGGLYGIQIGQVFFGESMFAKVNNASKFAFIRFVRQFEAKHGMLIDCQQQTNHLSSMGAKPVSRKEFVSLLEKYIPQNENIW